MRAKINWFDESGSNTLGAAYEARRNKVVYIEEHDTGSDRTLAACLIHASRARKFASANE